MTKNEYIERFIEVTEEYQKLSEQLLEKVSNNEANYGSYLVHGIPHNYSYNWLFGFKKGFGQCKLHGNAKKKTKKIQYKIHLEMFENNLQELKKELGQ